MAVYGTEELQETYGASKTTDSGTELDQVIDPDGALDEWIIFKQLISNNFGSCTLQSIAKELSKSEAMQEQYPNLLAVNHSQANNTHQHCRL